MNDGIRPLGELARSVSTPATAVVGAVSAEGGRMVAVLSPWGPGSSIASSPSPITLARALQRRLTLAVGVAILAAGVCGPAAWFLVPSPKFRAQAVLQVAAQPPQVLFRTVETQGGGNDYIRYQKTQLGLVKSRFALNAALQEEGVKKYRMLRDLEDPIKWLQDTLEVSFVAESELMEIALSGNLPEELAGLVNAVKKAYMDEVVNVEHKRRLERHDTLKRLSKQYADTLKGRRETLRRLAESVGSDNRETLAIQQQFAIEHLAAVKKELLEVQSQKRKAEALLKTRRLESFQETVAPTVSNAEVDRLIEQDPKICALSANLANMQQRLASESAHSKQVARNSAMDPVLNGLRAEVASLKKSLARERAAIRPIVMIRQIQNPDTDAPVSQDVETRQQLAMLEDLEQRLNGDIKSLSEGNHSLTVNTFGLQEIQDDIAQIQEAANKIGSEVEALNVELGAPPRIRVVEDAVVPRTRNEMKWYMMIGLITFGSFFGALYGVAFLELQSRKVDSADDVVADLGLSIIGVLPILPARVRCGVEASHQGKDRYWYNLLLESIEATRTMLIHAARSESVRVVMITSALGGEGKTSLVSQLATSLARSGLKTLIIDADLRSPAIHRRFDLPPGPGLSELLRGEVDLDGVIAATAIDELKIISAGTCDERTLRILTQGGMGTLFGQLKTQFDFVIVDSSPILPVADGLMIAQQADAVLFSILRDVSRKTKVFAATQRFSTLGIRILGAVVTGANGGGVYGIHHYRGSVYPAPRQQADPSPESSS